MTDTAEEIVFNGINGSTGAYVTPPLTMAEVATAALGLGKSEYDKRSPSPLLQDLLEKSEQMRAPDYIPASGVDVNDLASSGWGVIFTQEAIQAGVKDALKPLLEHRKALASRESEKYYQEYFYVPGMSKSEFLESYGVGSGPADPENMPYYLLIVGDPTTIPFEFQYQLDVQYAVGRLCFDTPEEYAIYAQSVVDVETGKARQLPRKAAFFAVRNDDDRATNLSCDQLTLPLLDKLKAAQGLKRWKGPQWDYQLVAKQAATKARLLEFLGGKETPALLFTASHGMGFDLDDSRLLPHQGALLCQDWPGPVQWKKPIPQDHYVAYDDLTDDARLLGLIAFHFACFGLGTPKFDQFNHKNPGQMKEIAPHDFIARLPRRMLSHPQGGALAVVGHVERAWGHSFMEAGGAHFVAFESLMKDLLNEGRPVGAALEYFNARYAELASDLSLIIQGVLYQNQPRDDRKLASKWAQNNDSRNYIILGDPAVRVPVGKEGDAAPERPTIGSISAPKAASASAAEVAPAPAALASGDGASVGVAMSAEAGGTEVQFGLFGSGDAAKQVTDALKEAMEKFVARLSAAFDDLSSLEVETYTSSSIGEVDYEGGKFTGPVSLRALTRISFDGDTRNVLPEKEGGAIDMALWDLHREMVAQAQENRAKMIATVASALASLVGASK